jgi:hypothetical protein
MNDYADVLSSTIIKGSTLAATGVVIDQPLLLGVAAGLVMVGVLCIEMGFRRGKKATEA